MVTKTGSRAGRNWYHGGMVCLSHHFASPAAGLGLWRLGALAARIGETYGPATIVAVALTTVGCSTEPATLELRGNAMGTGYEIKVVAPGEGSILPLDLVRERIAARLEDIEDRFSTYRENSEISRFNAHSGQGWFSISPEFLEVLRLGIAMSELTGGAFDPTVAPLVELWGFGTTDRSDRVPPGEAVDRLLSATGHTHLELREAPPAVRRTHTGVQLDLSAVAKGHAVDEIWKLLADAGLSAFTVELGGEVRSRGQRADGRDWSIGIENPDGTSVAEAVPLRNAAIATSGDYRNYFDYEGQRYSHIVDPRTGWAVSHDLTAVSVISSTAATADALATALLVLGPEAALEFAEREGIAARLVSRTADGFRVVRSPAYEALP